MPLSIVFLGTSSFAVTILQALTQDERFTVPLVITQPAKPVGRKQTMTPSPVRIAAESHGITVLEPKHVAEVRDRIPPHDFMVVASYGHILPQHILDLPRIAPVNVHASLLPTLRGASPIQHAILQGLPETGVTIQRMVLALDAGPILAQVRVPITSRMTMPVLHDTLAAHGAALLCSTLTATLHESPQSEEHATFCAKLTRKDGIADPQTMTATTIDRMVRALVPWPGVKIRDTKILATDLVPSPDALAVPCAQHTTLYVRSLQPHSSAPMSGKAFVHGRHTL